MSRCSRRVAAGLAVVLVTAALARPAPAFAEDTAPVLDIVAPVLDIVAPRSDISFNESDLKRQARVETTPQRTKITLDATVLFAKDSATINPRAQGRLGEIGRRLAGRGAGSVSITGYTDDLGSAAHGLTLSRQRANAVARVLRRDLPPSAFPFEVTGKGEEDPAVPNTSERNRTINRRVVVDYQRR